MSMMNIRTSEFSKSRRLLGFTVIELMITVGIIALLAAIAIPGYVQARHFGMRSAYVTELRRTSDAFEMYANDNGSMPPTSISNPANLLDDANRAVPGGLEIYMPKNSSWTSSPPIAPGGLWGWINTEDFADDISGTTGTVSYGGFIITTNVQATAEQMESIDTIFDDGNILDGGFLFNVTSTGLGTAVYGVE